MATSYAVCFGQSLTHKACREARKEAATPRYLCLRGLWPPARSARGRKHEALPPGFGSVAPHYNNSCRERKKGFFLFPFFSHLFRLPLHSAFEELDWECEWLILFTPNVVSQKKPPQKTPAKTCLVARTKKKKKKVLTQKNTYFVPTLSVIGLDIKYSCLVWFCLLGAASWSLKVSGSW